MAEQPGLTTDGMIREMVRRIVERFSPEKVILFGSYARGAATPDSDVDLMVVMKCSGPPHEQAVAIRRILANLPVSKDIVVVTPEYFEEYHDIVGTVVWPAVREGRLLYDRAA